MIKEEIRHALAFLIVSVATTVAWLAAQSDDVALLDWPIGIIAFLAIVFLTGVGVRIESALILTRSPQKAIRYFDWSWLAYAVPVGMILSIPLIAAAKLPSAWADESATVDVLRVVIAYAVVEGIKLLALDGKWLKERLAVDAQKLFRSTFDDSDFAASSDEWRAVYSDGWQGGWGTAARANRAKAIQLAVDKTSKG